MENGFGRSTQVIEQRSVAEAIAAGAGVAMNGLRASVFLPGDFLAEGFAQLQSLASRHVPLVVHAALREGFGPGSSHAVYHGSSDLGLFQVMPHTVQQALDFTVLAHWLAERTLIPGLVAVDRRVAENVRMPSEELLQAFLGDPEAPVPVPSPAQLSIFGGERPVVPAWFDLDRPVAFGTLQGSNEAAAAEVGREVFFVRHLKEALRDGLEMLGRRTGRRWDLVTTDGLEGADTVVVVQGSAYETVRAAAQYLRRERGWRVGVLGVTWLRPFPGEVLRQHLAVRKQVAVLESAAAAFSEEGPLMREIRRAVPEHDGVWVSGVYGLHGQPLAVGQVIRLVEELRGNRPRPKVWLGFMAGPDKWGEYPKRAALVQAVQSDYPELSQGILSSAEVEKLSADEVRGVQWVGASREDPGLIVDRLKALVNPKEQGGTRAIAWYPEPGILCVRVSAGPDELALAESGLALDLVLVGRVGLDVLHNPLADLKERRAVVIQSDRAGSEIWRLLPAYWRSEVKRLQLRLYQVDGDFDRMLEAASELLNGRDGGEAAVEIDWRDQPVLLDEPEEVPALIRRAGQGSGDYASLPRFWGEVMQPKRAGITDNFPDPLVAVGAIPPYTAALARPRGTALPSLPVLNPENCTGCGNCWPVCPDSAIGASLVGLQEYLDAALAATGREGKVASALKRAHRNVAARLSSLLREGNAHTVVEEHLRDAYDYVLQRLSIPPDQEREYHETVSAVVEAATQISPVVTGLFFHQPEGELKGSGQLLMLAFNPHACQGCRLCITSCPESALEAFDRAGTAGADARTAWKFWEELPDTPGVLVEKAREQLDLGLVAARLLSRHSALVQAVGSFGEPGSGERLAVRLVTALLESRMQFELTRYAGEAEELAGKMRELLHSLLAEGLEKADPEAIERALLEVPRRRVSLGELTARLERFGRQVVVDPVKTVRVAQVIQQLESEVSRVREGNNNLGRSRFGVVIVSRRAACWAGRYPNHPYNAPLVVEPSPEGMSLALGVAEALTHRHLDKMRTLRRARYFLENPPDLPGRLASLHDLTWSGLSQEERTCCPPLLVLVDDSALERQAVGVLSRLLTGDLPVKLIFLDARDVRISDPEPVLTALGIGNAVAVSASLGYLEHFGEALETAFSFAGPALIHVHVPIPAEHGFETNQTLQRARAAVEARIHPLLVYDPRKPGALGARVRIDANPALKEAWGGTDPVAWLAGEARFRRFFAPLDDEDASTVDAGEYLLALPEERGDEVPVWEFPDGKKRRVDAVALRWAEQRYRVWKVLKEIGGVDSPFVERLREELETEVAARNRAEFERIRSEYEERIAALEQGFEQRMAEVLRQRLLQLTGFAEVSAGSEDR
ncbi:MAG TPA: 4Fe-4S binding protein [Acidobacteriota bacterium]|nr:4Fe-4S binding protein [Acidobacteriota bacterium]